MPTISDASLYRQPRLRGNRNNLSCLSGFVIEERRMQRLRAGAEWGPLALRRGFWAYPAYMIRLMAAG